MEGPVQPRDIKPQCRTAEAPFDFSAAAYQVESNWIHFEAQDGTTIHRHSSGVTMGDLFESLG